jgi:alkylation response protein AidB-like acyl-CoA dehydrogenase
MCPERVDLSPRDDEFREQVRNWLSASLTGEFAGLCGAGGPGSEHEMFDERIAWNRHLAAAGLTCLSWPAAEGGRGLTVFKQMIFHEEYARAEAPAKVSHFGEELLGPTLIEFGTAGQRRRFLPEIASVSELWCQGFSEPGAGSDLAAVTTSARLDGGHWVITGQKVWTSLAHVAGWCFVLARTVPGSRRGAGLSLLLVPMRQPGVIVRPIRQLTGTSEFNEVFFDGARTDAGNVLGEPGDGWRVARYLLGVERGVATFGQLIGYRRQLARLMDVARRSGAASDPLIRDRFARAWTGLEVIRAHALATTGGQPDHRGGIEAGARASMLKLAWASWHRGLGELAMDVRGAAPLIGPGAAGELDQWQRLFLFSRADTIYGGSNEIQRTIIAERALGLPREPRP